MHVALRVGVALGKGPGLGNLEHARASVTAQPPAGQLTLTPNSATLDNDTFAAERIRWSASAEPEAHDNADAIAVGQTFQ